MDLRCLSESKSKLRLTRVITGLDKSLNQIPQGGLEKIDYMSSNGPLRNCCKVPDKYLIGHVLGGQNGRSTLSLFVCSFDFSSLGPHLRFSLCLFLVPLVSHHWDAILGLI